MHKAPCGVLEELPSRVCGQVIDIPLREWPDIGYRDVVEVIELEWSGSAQDFFCLPSSVSTYFSNDITQSVSLEVKGNRGEHLLPR